MFRDIDAVKMSNRRTVARSLYGPNEMIPEVALGSTG
jgi:hypothetical protein